jgi:2-polyprenyl-3-methyl-5-hydroxy-6-metoxy-1,4-benzoquinol methylase
MHLGSVNLSIFAVKSIIFYLKQLKIEDNMRISRNSCPVCDSTRIQKFLETADYSLTQDSFDLYKCQDCQLAFTQNVPDQQSIGPYYDFKDYVSHTDTSDSFFHKIYHAVRNYTLSLKKGWLEKYTHKTHGELLDIGSGTGAFIAHMKSQQWEVLGIEEDATARKNAEQIHGIRTLPSTALYQQTAHSRDAISMWHVLEHVHDLHGYMAKIHEILKPSGVFFIAVPNYTSFDARYYKKHWAAYDVPRHLYHFSPTSIAFLAKKHGFHLEQHQPMWFDSVYVSMLSEKYRRGFGPLGIFIGLISNLLAVFNPLKCSSIVYVLRKKDK